MRIYQNETRPQPHCNAMHGAEKYAMQPVSALLRVPRCGTATPPRAFTLTELLVVITIIAILTSLITVAAVNALRTAKQARITLEIQQLGNAIEDFKTEYQAYPPNGMIQAGNNTLGNSISAIVKSDMERMFKKAFPRHQEPPALIAALSGNGPSGPNRNLGSGMTAAEALVFWLGGFSKDPKFPLSGPGGPSFEIVNGDILEEHNRRFEFDLGRLEPKEEDGTFDDDSDGDGGKGRFINYTVNINGVDQDRRINFWQYAPSGSGQPLVYFDVSRHKPEKYDMHAVGDVSSGAPMIHAIEKRRGGLSGLPGTGDLVFVNQGKFQILHAGLDDVWGDAFMRMSLFMTNNASEVMTFPEGPFIGDIADTLSNFSTGTLEDEQE